MSKIDKFFVTIKFMTNYLILQRGGHKKIEYARYSNRKYFKLKKIVLKNKYSNNFFLDKYFRKVT